MLGDRALPARAVPGDGAIPIEPFIRQVLAGGYTHGFDLELIGPRIEAEGRIERGASRLRIDIDDAGKTWRMRRIGEVRWLSETALMMRR